jgi:hypothetical protein
MKHDLARQNIPYAESLHVCTYRYSKYRQMWTFKKIYESTKIEDAGLKLTKQMKLTAEARRNLRETVIEGSRVRSRARLFTFKP